MPLRVSILTWLAIDQQDSSYGSSGNTRGVPGLVEGLKTVKFGLNFAADGYCGQNYDRDKSHNIRTKAVISCLLSSEKLWHEMHRTFQVLQRCQIPKRVKCGESLHI